jgi:hypothetical protein
MTRAELKHLRRLVAWVRCEIGQTPEELEATVREILPKIGPIDDGGKARLVQAHDRARHVPKYVRAAVAALGRTLEVGETVEEARPDPAPARQARERRRLQGGRPARALPAPGSVS